MGSFNTSWTTWKPSIVDRIGTTPSVSDLLNLGDYLSETFKLTATIGRGQGTLSGGGYAWEGLINWYLNLGFLGSRGVAFKKMSDLPTPLKDSISVNYGNFISNTESDIAVVIFPDLPEFTQPMSSIPSKVEMKSLVSKLVEQHFNDFQLGIIQCKTNWNDNAQIPMLWGMIYETEGFRNDNISIGKNGFSMKHLKKFTYSFCTIPSNKLELFKANSTSVNRVRNLSGGNFWGYSSKTGIASSIKEIFNHNFESAFPSSQRSTLRNEVNFLKNKYAYFNLLT